MRKRKFKIYFASPLFSDMERAYNSQTVDRLRQKFKKDIDVYLPQENEEINNKSGYADSKMIAVGDNKELINSDLVVAVLDGISIDNGVASEIGIAYALGIPVLALYTDSRQGTFGNEQKIEALDKIAESQFSYINLYTVGLIKSSNEIHGEALKDNGLYNNVKDLISGIEYFTSLNKRANTLLSLSPSIDLVAMSTNRGLEFMEYSLSERDIHSAIERHLKQKYKRGSLYYRIVLSKSICPTLTFTTDSDYHGQSLIRELNNIYNSLLLGYYNDSHYIQDVYILRLDSQEYYVDGHHYDKFGIIKTAKSYRFKVTEQQYNDISIGNDVVVPMSNYNGKNPSNAETTVLHVTHKGLLTGDSKHPKTDIISVLKY